MVSRTSDSYEVLRRFAPGTALRIAVELIHAQGTGALIVIGAGAKLEALSSGGFHLHDTTFTAQRIAELAKMDGGIVVDDEKGSITRANVHFIPDPTIETNETGTRFRTAERMAIQTGSSPSVKRVGVPQSSIGMAIATNWPVPPIFSLAPTTR